MDDPPVELLLSLHPPAIQGVAERLRAIVFDAVPGAIEIVDALQPPRRGQRVLGYRVRVTPRRAPHFAWILAEQVHAHLGFTYGVLLRDPEGILEGREFRRVRYVTFREPGEIRDEPALRRLLLEAAAVAGLTHAERIARMVDPEPATL